MTARRDSVFLSLLEHAQMNRIVLDEMDADIKFKEARKEAALVSIGKAICGFLVRRNVSNLAYCGDSLRKTQFYMRNSPRAGIYFRYCLSFFKHQVLYFRLKNVAGLACLQFVRCCIMKDFDCGTVVCRQGDSCDFFYVLIEGLMTITQRLGHVDKVLGAIRSGASFGEIGIIRQTQRTATITATTKCSVLMIDKNSFLEILHLSNPEMVLKKTNFLLTLPIFQSAPRTTLEHLSHVMALQHWKAYDHVYRRCRFGGFDDRLLVVLSGHVHFFVEPFLSENEISERMIKHNSRSCTCYSTKALQESQESSKSWLPCAKERGRCVCECGVGSFLNIHSLFRNDSPDCCIIAGPKGATVLVVQKIDLMSIVEKGKSKQLFQNLAEQSWNAMCQRQNTVSELSFSKFPYRQLVGQSILISRPASDSNTSNIVLTHMKRYLSGPRLNKIFPPLDLHRISGEKQQSSLKPFHDISCVGKEFMQSPRVSRAMQQASFLYRTLQHSFEHSFTSRRDNDSGSSSKDSTSIFAVPAGNSTPLMLESANTVSDLPHQDHDYVEMACIKFSKDLKDVQNFLHQSDRNVSAIHPLNSHRTFTPRAPSEPQDSEALGVRGARILASTRSHRRNR